MSNQNISTEYSSETWFNDRSFLKSIIRDDFYGKSVPDDVLRKLLSVGVVPLHYGFPEESVTVIILRDWLPKFDSLNTYKNLAVYSNDDSKESLIPYLDNCFEDEYGKLFTSVTVTCTDRDSSGIVVPAILSIAGKKWRSMICTLSEVVPNVITNDSDRVINMCVLSQQLE